MSLFRNKKGLTLVELMVVTSVLVFLVLFGIIYLRTQIFKAKDVKKKADIHKIKIAMEEYEKDNNCYPKPETIPCDPGTALKPYTDKIPCDPDTGRDYYIEVEDSFCPSWYRIYAVLENEVDPDIDKLGCTYGCGPDYAYDFYQSSYNAPDPLKGTAPDATAPPIDMDLGSERFYGCVNGVCVPLVWDPQRPGPICDPNWQNSTCYGQCGDTEKECASWK